MSSIPVDLTECRFCSTISKANGEDPIGSASYTNHWLIVEIPQPWSAQLFAEDFRIQPVLALIRHLILKYGIKVKPIAIASDREYSQLGYTRILYYSRPAEFFAEFEKQEYLILEADTTRLAIAILKQIVNESNELATFQKYRQYQTTRDILVCTHGNVDVACARFGFPIYEKLRKEYAADSLGKLRVWRCSHFGGHQYAPTLIDLPEGRYWGHLEPEVLDALVHRQGSPSQLYQFYRGWAGVSKFEQIAEREIWMREGWDWLQYEKRGQIVRLGEKRLMSFFRKVLQPIPSKRLQFWLERSQQDANWAEVRLDFISPKLKLSGSYEARVEMSGQIMTAIHSDENMQLVPVNQYRVTQIQK